MARMVIDDALWKKLEALLPMRETGGRPPKDNRLFIEAVCWVIRTGAPWRDLPPEYGSWKTTYNRYNRWCKKGEFDRICVTFRCSSLEVAIFLISGQHNFYYICKYFVKLCGCLFLRTLTYNMFSPMHTKNYVKFYGLRNRTNGFIMFF